ncbi:MAG: STAS-like domain-containing protein [Oligoflexia bacterium]|nr:STAS-like domain-containing protein [Oligoflexia bacterium]
MSIKTISIAEDFKNDYVTRDAGEKLRNMIIAGEKDYEKIEIDFGDLIIASVSFFDEAFAKLIEHGWSINKINSRIILKNISPRDVEVHNKMLEVRRRM